MLAIVAQGICTSRAQLVTGFDDIQLWAGSGAQKAALVVDFHDGTSKQSFVWGFRWDGKATGYDMLTAISGLTTMGLSVDSTSYVTLMSYTESGITHSQDAYYTSYMWGYWIAGGSATVYPYDSSPQYDISISGGGTTLPGEWTVSPSGTSTRFLADGCWDAFSFGTYDLSTYVAQIPPGATSYASIPEPSAMPLILLGIGIMLYARKRLHAC